MIAQVTLHKRLKGLTKKAMEISLLTGVEINLTVYNPYANKLHQYLSSDDVEHKTYNPKYLSRYTNAQYEYLFKDAPVPED